MSDTYLHPDNPQVERRKFISVALRAACATAIVNMPPLALAGDEATPVTYSVQDIINIILKEIPGAPFAQTVDTLKSGSADSPVTGIVTTMFATINVIREAVRRKANFIIAHEPTFYNHNDDKRWVENNEIVRKKAELLEKHNITVWRFHDYWHTHVPDGVSFGVLKNAGWERYYRAGERILQAPPMTVKKIVEHLKSALGITHVKVIGDPQQVCRKIALMPGAAGGQRQVAVAEKEKPDLLIVGEVHEWETAEYIRDARALGTEISLIILGHSVSEEPGMQWLVEWLQPKVSGIKISHVASGDPFLWM